MKITKVETIKASKFLFVKIYTDEGIVGLGESGCWGFLDASAEVIKTFENYLIGKNPLKIEHHWQYMYRSFHFRGAAIMGALSSIDIALWDIAGQFFQVPTYQLLGGKTRDKARVYSHITGENTEEIIKKIKTAKSQGFTAVGHLSPFLNESRDLPYFETHAQKMSNAINRVEKFREAAGDEIDLCIEIHRTLRPSEAITFAKSIEKYHPFFYEDPTTVDNFDSMVHIANNINIPIATGERFHTPQEFAFLLSRYAVPFVRPDVCLCGGITGMKKIAAIAEAYDAMVVPHNPLSPVCTAASIQIAACIPNFSILEYQDPNEDNTTAGYRFVNNQANTQNESSDFKLANIVKNKLEYEDGFLIIPDKPGINAELVDNIENKYPYTRQTIKTRKNIDGSIIDQ